RLDRGRRLRPARLRDRRWRRRPRTGRRGRRRTWPGPRVGPARRRRHRHRTAGRPAHRGDRHRTRQRRLPADLGGARLDRRALAALALALPAGAAGLAAGAWLAYGPTSGLLASLNELAPGGALVLPLLGALACLTALVALSTLWPVWRAARRPPVTLLRGAGIAGARRGRLPAGPAGVGLRLATARRARLATSVAVLAVT